MLFNGTAHVLQIGAAVTRLIARDQVVNLAYDRLGVPLGCAAVPVVEADFAAKMQHQRFQWRSGVELEAHGM